MNPLLSAVKKAHSKLAIFYSVFIFAIAFIVTISILDSSSLHIIFAVIPFLAAAFLSLIITHLILSPKQCLKKITNILKEGSYGADELESIFLQLNSSNKISYFDQGYCLSLYITETWLILISTNGSIIEKRSNLLSIRKQFMTTQSRYAILLKFENRKLICPCDRICEELVQIIKTQTKGESK